MRATLKTFLLLAACVAARADDSVIAVGELSVAIPSALSVSAFATTTTAATITTATTPEPATKTPVTSTPSTTTASSTTTATTTTVAPSTTSPTSTSTTALTPATSTTTTSSSSSSSTSSLGPVTCAFQYSMPTSSNVQAELNTETSTTSSASGSTTSDSSTEGSSDSDVTVGSQDSTETTETTGSGAGTVDAGSADATTTKTPTPTPQPSPSSTKKTTTPQPTTKEPSATTPQPTTKTPAPSTAVPTAGDGSSDDSTRRFLAAGSETGILPTPTTATPSATTSKTPSPSSTVKTSTTAPAVTTTNAPASSSSSSSGSSTPSTSSGSSSSATTSTTTTTTASTGTFSCDANFYGAWAKLGLKCGDADLDVAAAVAQTQCLIYSGTQSSAVITSMKMCMSVCRFPKCTDGAWDYTADDGIDSSIYQNLNFLQLMRYAGASSAITGVVEQPFANLTMTTDKQCGYKGESSFSACQCNNLIVGKSTSNSSSSATSVPVALTVPVDKGLADSNHWADGQPKTAIDKVSIATTVIGGSAATVSVAVGGIASVAGTVMGSTSAGVASGVTTGASVGVMMAAVDLCQFGVMINQMKLDARPRFVEDMGKRMSSAGFTFLPFGKASNKTTAAGRRLSDDTSVANQTQGMERYAQLIGVETDMLFYLTVAGVGALIVALFLVYGIVMAICYSFVDDFGAFSKKWLDKAIGVLMMILILSEYVIGVTATFQFCWCIDNNRVDASLFLAIFAVLVLAIGTIMYGFVVIKNHEDELRDLGTKDHFDKRVHARYGPLYDEYKFEGRYFFAPKLLLALLCGMTTGMVWLSGLWQIVVMIALHIAFLFYLEVKQPYPTQFVQKTSSFVIIIKISALFLSFFLISSATSFNADIPLDLREGVGFAIIGLQVLVLVCLMIRQVYIFYRTWKLKSQGEEEDKTPVITTTNNRDGTEQFFALGENRQDPHNNTAMLEEGSQHYQHQSQDHFKLQSEVGNQPGKLRNLQPSRRTHTVVVHETGPGAYRNNEVDL